MKGQHKPGNRYAYPQPGPPVPPCPGGYHRFTLPDRVPREGVTVRCEHEGCGYERHYGLADFGPFDRPTGA